MKKLMASVAKSGFSPGQRPKSLFALYVAQVLTFKKWPTAQNMDTEIACLCSVRKVWWDAQVQAGAMCER